MTKSKTFEEALELLEDSVERLESGDLKLEDALSVFEEGVSASRLCSKLLDQTRKRVQVLAAEEDGEFTLSFLDDEELTDEEE
jgi:exodeoxyribonuclease VII small subunit